MNVIEELREILNVSRPSRRRLPLPILFRNFKSILQANNEVLELLAEMAGQLGGESVLDRQCIIAASKRIGELVFRLISSLSILTQSDNAELFRAFEQIEEELEAILADQRVRSKSAPIFWLDELRPDMEQEVGNKFNCLGEVRNGLGLRTPDGFVISTGVFSEFMEENGLFAYLEKSSDRLSRNDEEGFESLCRDVQRRILEGKLPRRLTQQVGRAAEQMMRRRSDKLLRFAVRSTAWGEDGENSFAGQYESVLGVPDRMIPQAYRQVIASAYSPESWTYRLDYGYKENEIAMAVGCQAMVCAVASGVMYSRSPSPDEASAILITGAWGLGPAVAQGSGQADTFLVERSAPHLILSRAIKPKVRMMLSTPEGGAGWTDVHDDLRAAPCLSDDQVTELALTALTLEQHFKSPQDIEWAFDKEGALYVLQSRPLTVQTDLPSVVSSTSWAIDAGEVLFSNRGAVVHKGVASGKVFLSRSEEDIKDFPIGAILVAQQTSPRYARIMRKANGIVTDCGSVTGHMAALAREYRIPTVVGTEVATKTLKPGEEVTLDTIRNVVYRGIVAGLPHADSAEQRVFEEAYEYRLLRRVLRKINPLNLVDPLSKDFVPKRCQTYHDITRYIHEKAVERLIELSERQHKYHGRRPKRLQSDPPLGLTVIDIKDGTSAPRDARSVTPDQITSRPFKALLYGLSESGMWRTDPVPMDMGSLMSSISRSFATPMPTALNGTRNLVVVSREYMNLNIKLGYHFTMLDAYIGEASNDNYIHFRFAGGMADVIRRNRRGRFIAEVLRDLELLVDTRGDVVIGRLKKSSPGKTSKTMKVLGGLIGYSRQLDVGMSSEEQVQRCLDDFRQRTRAFT